MGFISFGQALQIIGGTPIKTAKKVIAENLRVARNLSMPPELSGMLSNVLQNGPGSVLKNPMQAAIGGLGTSISTALGQLQGAANGPFNGLQSALSSTLTGALQNLTSTTNRLSGLTSPAVGQFGLLDLLSQGGSQASTLPASMSFQTAARPLQMQADVQTIAVQVLGLATDVVSGSVSEDEAITHVNAMVATINTAITASGAAMQGLQDGTVHLAGVGAAASALAGEDGPLKTLAASIIDPAQHQTIKDAFEAMRN